MSAEFFTLIELLLIAAMTTGVVYFCQMPVRGQRLVIPKVIGLFFVNVCWCWAANTFFGMYRLLASAVFCVIYFSLN